MINVLRRWGVAQVNTTLLCIGLALALSSACTPITPEPSVASVEISRPDAEAKCYLRLFPAGDVASVEISRPDAEVQVSEIGDAVFVDVISPTGIGNAEVTLAAPPGAMTVRLHLAGLEEYRFGYGDTEVLLSVSSSDASVRQSVRSSGGETAIEPDSPYWMDTRILDASGAATTTLPLRGGVIEVDAPQDFLEAGNQTFVLSWIDFYR